MLTYTQKPNRFCITLKTSFDLRCSLPGLLPYSRETWGSVWFQHGRRSQDSPIFSCSLASLCPLEASRWYNTCRDVSATWTFYSQNKPGRGKFRLLGSLRMAFFPWPCLKQSDFAIMLPWLIFHQLLIFYVCNLWKVKWTLDMYV